MLIFLKQIINFWKKNILKCVPDELVVIANCYVSLQITCKTILETEDYMMYTKLCGGI